MSAGRSSTSCVFPNGCAVEAERATLSFYTVTGCHWLSFLRELRSNPAVIADILHFCRNDSVALG
jgi:hypothetical protein